MQAHRARLADYCHDGFKHHHAKQAGQVRDQAGDLILGQLAARSGAADAAIA